MLTPWILDRLPESKHACIEIFVPSTLSLLIHGWDNSTSLCESWTVETEVTHRKHLASILNATLAVYFKVLALVQIVPVI